MAEFTVRAATLDDLEALTEIYNHYIVHSAITFDLRPFGFRLVGVFHAVGRKFDRFWDVAWFERPLRLDASEPTPQE